MRKLPKPEWTKTVMVAELGAAPSRYTMRADADVCAALVDRFDVISLDDLHANITIARTRGGRVYHVTGTVAGRVTQACVVTNDPVVTTVTAEIDSYFSDLPPVVPIERARAERAPKGSPPPEVRMLDESEQPESVNEGVIDIGEIASQFFSLSIPAYPRAVDGPPIEVVAGRIDQGDAQEGDDDPGGKGPFAGLKAWREGIKKGTLGQDGA